jgi:drug/metabolite transporter (DMT)-like permease
MEPKTRATVATLVSSFFWGSSFPVIGYGVKFINPFLFLFLRFLIAVPVALIVFTALKKPLLPALRSGTVWFLGALNALAFVLQYAAQGWTSATNVALFINLYIIFVAIGSVTFLKERLSWPLGVAIGLGFVGVYLVETNAGTASISIETLKGDVFALIAGLVWSVYIILSKMMLSAGERSGRLSPEQLTGGVCITTLVPLTFVLPLTVQGPVAQFPIVIGLATYLAIFTTILAYLLWYNGLKELSAIVTQVLVLLEVAFAAIISFVVFKDRFGPGTVLGGIIICIAAFLATYNPKRR